MIGPFQLGEINVLNWNVMNGRIRRFAKRQCITGIGNHMACNGHHNASVIADTRNSLTLRESDYSPVQYIPREDVDLTQLERTDHATYCPYKGDCNYYSVPAGGRKSVNAVWSYEDPFPAVTQIKGHVAFYPDRVDEIAEQRVM